MDKNVKNNSRPDETFSPFGKDEIRPGNIIHGKVKTGIIFGPPPTEAASWSSQQMIDRMIETSAIFQRSTELGKLLHECLALPVNLPASENHEKHVVGVQMSSPGIVLVDSLSSGELDNGLAITTCTEPHVSGGHLSDVVQHLLKSSPSARILAVVLGDDDCVLEEDKRLLHFSLTNAEFPGKADEISKIASIGKSKNKKKGCSIRIRLGSSVADCLTAILQIILPMAFEFNPQMVLVYMDFKAFIQKGVPNSPSSWNPAVVGHFVHLLLTLAGGKCAVILEERLDLEATDAKYVSQCAQSVLEALRGYPCRSMPGVGDVSTGFVFGLQHAVNDLHGHWRCFEFPKDTGAPARRGRSKTPGGISDNSVTSKSAKPSVSVLDKELSELQLSDFGALSLPNHRTCLVYDTLMLGHTAEIDNLERRPETPERLEAIFSRLTVTGLVNECLMLTPRDAETAEMSTVHSPEYVDSLSLAPAVFAAEVEKRKLLPTKRRGQWPYDVWATEGTQPAIWRAAGSLLNVVEAVLTGAALNGYAIIRPPGHHAHRESPAGFCFANNVAIAAKYALERHNIKRILIVDWDVHHGDGVQEAFYDDDRVCYISLHRGQIDFYPEGKQKGANFTGNGAGAGFNINIPWQDGGMGDEDYIAAFLQLILPVAYEYQPELVLVCCGFDAAMGDSMGECRLTNVGYGIMTRMLMGLAGGKIILALEGGYHLQMLAKCSESIVRALLGFPVYTIPQSLVCSDNAARDIECTVAAHQTVRQGPWHCLRHFRVVRQPFSGDAPTPGSRQNTPVQSALHVPNDLLLGMDNLKLN